MIANRGEPLIEGLGTRMEQLWQQQLRAWPMLTRGMQSLREARTRILAVEGARVLVQCNPARLASTSARIDPRSLAHRRCFLCQAHLPPEQSRLPYGNEWLILCNPAPIFDPHFTIVSTTHEPQRVERAVKPLMQMARDLAGKYTLLYNGPKCGASAPDHLHLQAVPAGVMPLEIDLLGVLKREAATKVEWLRTDKISVGLMEHHLWPAIIIVTESVSGALAGIDQVLDVLGQVHPVQPEPMINLYARMVEGRLVVWMVPRAQHRPSIYGDDANAFMISPGSADVAGVIISPRPDDFDRLDASTISQILKEVVLTPDQLAALRERLASPAYTVK